MRYSEEYFFTLPGKVLSMSETGSVCRYFCLECAYIYDPAKGDPKGNIPPGTPFEKVPDTWRCPECKILKVKKGVFKRLDS